jgi:hypothetical protein
MRTSDSAPDAEVLEEIETIINKVLGYSVAVIMLSVFCWALFQIFK